MRTVTLYVRPGCHLCDDALAVLAGVRAQHPFELDVVDIEGDDALLARYLERIPVLAVDGVDVADFHVDASHLRELLAGPSVL